MTWLQIYVCAMCVALLFTSGMSAAKHGEPKTGNWSMWVYVWAIALEAPIYYAAIRYAFNL